jgi:hypothetical protein
MINYCEDRAVTVNEVGNGSNSGTSTSSPDEVVVRGIIDMELVGLDSDDRAV